ncbi:MAG TPA: hypothetical protein VGM44_21755 [Polyangiaceae bacterium]
MSIQGGIALINANSLSETVDALNAAKFEGRKLSLTERRRVASWLVARQGLPGAYGDMFAGFAGERAGIVVFTGERITSASARHILGEEASRALRMLDVPDRAVRQALERASTGMLKCLERAEEDPRNQNPGRYCCGKCTVGLWRNLLAGGLDRQAERLAAGVRHLRSARDDDGGWHKFPFWFTVLALGEMDFSAAKRELAHVRPTLERAAARKGSTVHARRRHELARRVLERN